MTGTDPARARADVVGSLLRPPELLEARQQAARGELTPARLAEIEDAAVDAALALQERAGVDVVTDGEQRRLSFQSRVVDAVSGFGDVGLDAFLWGDWRSEDLGTHTVERPPLAVVERLARRRFPFVEEFTYARDRARRPVKVTLPSPSLFAGFWDPDRSAGAYPTLDAFLGHVADLLREEVDELARLGARSVQLDAPHYTLVVDPAYRDFYASRGWPHERWLGMAAELDNEVLGDRADVVTGLHLCRGNQASRWLVAGDYAALAERLFGAVRVDRLLLEYDDARSGSFDPLAAVPDGTVAVLGLVTTKRPQLESTEALRGRVAEASRHRDPDLLALSPQCGFATSVLGNALSVADQEAKLRLVAQTAETVWG